MSRLNWIRWIVLTGACFYNGFISFNFFESGLVRAPARAFLEILNLPGLLLAIAMRGGVLSHDEPGATFGPWAGTAVNTLLVAGILYLVLFVLPRVLTK
jgi:hypothetical protein